MQNKIKNILKVFVALVVSHWLLQAMNHFFDVSTFLLTRELAAGKPWMLTLAFWMHIGIYFFGFYLGMQIVWMLIRKRWLFAVGSSLILVTGIGLLCLAFFGQPKPGDSVTAHFFAFGIMGSLMLGFGSFMHWKVQQQKNKRM